MRRALVARAAAVALFLPGAAAASARADETTGTPEPGGGAVSPDQAAAPSAPDAAPATPTSTTATSGPGAPRAGGRARGIHSTHPTPASGSAGGARPACTAGLIRPLGRARRARPTFRCACGGGSPAATPPTAAAAAPANQETRKPAWHDPAPSSASAASSTSPPPSAPSSPAATVPIASAQNMSTVFQTVWQVQQGCKTYCYATSQTQTATQSSATNQKATATGSASTPTGALALNVATTIQFIVQTQLGCVAFCYSTSQTQSASQDAQTTQLANATADAIVTAINVADTFQFVWQIQDGCSFECRDVTTSQSVAQNEATDQQQTTSAATSGAPPFDGPQTFLAWIAVIAGNVGATVQTIYQYDEATCLENCTGDAQAQDAAQSVVTDQEADAFTDGQSAPVSAAPPSGGTPEPGPPIAPPSDLAPQAPVVVAAAPLPAPAATAPSVAGTQVSPQAATAARIASPAPSPQAAPTMRVASAESSHTDSDIARTGAPLPARHAQAAVAAPRDVVAPPGDAARRLTPPRTHALAHRHAHVPLFELPAMPRAALDAIRAQPGHRTDGALLAAGLALLAALAVVRTARRRTM